MDRNEIQNSFRNIQNSRGKDRLLKKYKTAFHISLAAAIIFAGSTGVLGIQYLKGQDVKTEKTVSETPKEKPAQTLTVTPTLTVTSTAAPDITPTGASKQTDKFEILEKTLKDKIPNDTQVHIRGIGEYADGSYGEIEGINNLQEYTKLFIIGKVYDQISKGEFIRESNVIDSDTDLAKIVLAVLGRNSETENYNDRNNKSSKELLLRIGERADRKEQREKNEDEYGYVSRKSDEEGYDADIKQGVNEVNKYIETQLSTKPKITEKMSNTITLTDCETYLGKQLTEENDKLCKRLGKGTDKAKIVYSVQKEIKKDDNIKQIWISADVKENQKVTITGVYDKEEKKGYILSVCYPDGNNEKEISSAVYEVLMKNINSGEKS